MYIGDGTSLSAWKLWKNQMLAMFIKKGVSIVRSWRLVLVQIIIPVVLVIATILPLRSTNNVSLPEMDFSLDDYDLPITTLSGSSVYKTEYLNILKESNHLYEDIGSENISEYILQKTTETPSVVNRRYILATNFEEDLITLLFNNQPYHSPPLALAQAIKSIVRTKLNSSYNIRLTNYPLPPTTDTEV